MIDSNTKRYLFQINKWKTLVFTLIIGIFLSVLISNTTARADETSQLVWYPQGKGSLATQDGDTFSTTNIWLGTGENTQESYLGIVFRGQKLPDDAKITSVKVRFSPTSNRWTRTSFEVGHKHASPSAKFTKAHKITEGEIHYTDTSFSDNIIWNQGKFYDYEIQNPKHPIIEPNSEQAVLVFHGKGRSWGRKSIVSIGEFAPQLVITYTKETPKPTPTQAESKQDNTTITPTHEHTPSKGNSHAMGLWNPTPQDTCSKEVHDSYSVVGPDGKKYPTWHPPIHTFSDGTTCTFGHEHGRDPKDSHLMPFIKEYFGGENSEQSGLAFGYASEQLDAYNTSKGITGGMRHEDHVGHKVEWENDVPLHTNKCTRAASDGCFETTTVDITCDFLMKIHQGTHSQDAFTNNMHELEYFVSCSDGTKVAATKMVTFGKPGEFTASTKDKDITAGSPTPQNSPTGGGARFIPTLEAIQKHILVPQGQWSQYSQALYEDWVSSNYIRKAGSDDFILYFDPHFAVFAPSRYFDPTKSNNLGRTTDICNMTEANGEKFRGGECDQLTDYGKNTNIAYDSVNSPFNGVKREMYFNQTTIKNSTGPTTWYTDPFGGNAQTTPFPGSIKQYIAQTNNTDRPTLESQAIGANRNYGGNGVHAPN